MHRIIWIFLGSFVVSTFGLRWWAAPSYPLTLWIVLWGIAFAGLFMRPGRALTAAALGALLALWVVSGAMTIDPDSPKHYADGSVVTVRGIIADTPEDRGTKVDYVLATEHGKILLTDSRLWPRHAYGDEIDATGALSVPEKFEDFDYEAYLQMRGIDALMKVTTTTIIDHENGNAVLAFLIGLRSRFEATIASIIPEPAAALLTGLLTGSRTNLPQRVQDDFRAAGLTHIVAISGSNITIIVQLLGTLLFFLPIRFRLVPSVIGIALFTLFVGASASVVRAAIMGSIGLLALHSGRLYHARLAILWTAFAMTLWNPLQLWHDAGFQLSFLAVIGLTECMPILQKYLAKIPATLGLRDTLLATLAAQITTIPLSAMLFQQVSLIAPVSNMFVAPLIPPAMLFGFVATLLGSVHPILAFLPAALTTILLELIIGISHVSARIPFAAIGTGKLHSGFMAAAYAGTALVLWYLQKKSRQKSAAQ